jgi:hypothetical protein
VPHQKIARAPDIGNQGTAVGEWIFHLNGVNRVPFQLSSFVSRFDEVCQQKFGRSYDLASLEKYFLDHASGKRHLTAKDVSKLFNAEITPYGKYWPRPHMKTLEENLREKRIYLGLSGGDPKALVQNLLSVFHNIGTASLLLRFVHPQQFGIFSTPIIHLLLVTRPATIDLYLAYCKELEKWCEHFKMASAAQTETALWAFAEYIKLADKDVGAASAMRAFDNDMWIQRERAAQVIRPFFRRYGRLQLARILLDEDPILSGKIAAEEYERLLNCASMHLHKKPLSRNLGAASALVDELATKGYIRLEQKTDLYSIWETRNKVVHPSGRRAEREEVDIMIDYIERIAVPWGKFGLKGDAVRSRTDPSSTSATL